MIDGSLGNVNTNAGQVQAIGGQEVDDLASELRLDLNDAHETVFIVLGCSQGLNPPATCARTQEDHAPNAYLPRDRFLSNRREYLKAAQEELGPSD